MVEEEERGLYLGGVGYETPHRRRMRGDSPSEEDEGRLPLGGGDGETPLGVGETLSGVGGRLPRGGGEETPPLEEEEGRLSPVQEWRLPLRGGGETHPWRRSGDSPSVEGGGGRLPLRGGGGGGDSHSEEEGRRLPLGRGG